MITILRKEALESVGEVSEVCSQIVLKCLYLARIGRPDILCSVNTLARSVTKWTQAYDKRLARLIFYIHHTNDYRQYCHVENTAQHCRLGFIPRLRLCHRLWGLKVNLRRCVVYFWKHNICPSQLDVQETNIGFAQLYRIWSHFRWMLDYVWMGYLLLIFVTSWLKFYIEPKTKLNPNILATRKLVQFLIQKPRPNALWPVPCRNEDKKQLRVRVIRWQKPDIPIWWCTVSAKEDVSPQRSRSLVNPENDDDRKRVGLASGNWGHSWLKLRSWKFPSESTWGGQSSPQETWAERPNPSKKWWGLL